MQASPVGLFFPLPRSSAASPRCGWVLVGWGRTSLRWLPLAPGSGPPARTSHEDVLGQREAVRLADLPALQVDQEGVHAGPVEDALHLPVDGGRQAVLVEVLDPAAHQAALLRVVDGGEGQLRGERRRALTPARLPQPPLPPGPVSAGVDVSHSGGTLTRGRGDP